MMEQYDNVLNDLLTDGVRKKNRTGIDTFSLFGVMTEYDISDSFPILTRRKMRPEAIWAELLWFLSGSTNNYDLIGLGSNIWTPWANAEFETAHSYRPGELGPLYGFQLRNFNGDYENKSGGTDQWAKMLDLIVKDPNSRRNLFNLWNPNQLAGMRLEPCHYSFQVDVTDGKVNGLLCQRSCDWPIGVPANIQFYSAIIYLLAQWTMLKPGKFVHSCADAHIYENQVEAVKEYLSRDVRPSPTLTIKSFDLLQRQATRDQVANFKLEGYDPDLPIKIPVAV